MSATKTILAVGFVFFFGITLLYPLFPPASLMHKYVSIPQATLSYGEISVATLLDGIINGLFWILFTGAAYGLVQLTFPARIPGPLAPMPFARHMNMPVLENRLVDSCQNIIPPHLTVPPSKACFSKRKKVSKRPIRKKPVIAEVSKTRIKRKNGRKKTG